MFALLRFWQAVTRCSYIFGAKTSVYVVVIMKRFSFVLISCNIIQLPILCLMSQIILFGKCHIFRLSLVDPSLWTVTISHWLFQGISTKGQLHMWSRCRGKCVWGVWSCYCNSSFQHSAVCLHRTSGRRDFKKHFHGGETDKSQQLKRDSEGLRWLLEVQSGIRLGWKVCMQ